MTRHNPGKTALKHFEVLKHTGFEIGTGNIVCLANDLLPIDKNNWYVPA